MATTLTLQPSTGLDTYILHFTGYDDTNFSTEANLTIQPYSSTVIKRILLKFDITTLPANAIITSAKIGLRLSSALDGGSTDMEAHSITRSWTASTVTWNRYDGTNAWTTAGGDFDATVIDVKTIVNTAGFYEWSITPSIVDGWKTTNNGILFKGSNETISVNDKYFDASESATAGNRPYLTIVYELPSSGFPAYKSMVGFGM